MTGPTPPGEPPAVTGAILAGGDSRRMGRNKALLSIGGRSIIQTILAALQPLFAELLVISNDAEAFTELEVPIRPDRLQGRGALGGIHAALFYSRLPQTFCIGCDMPLVNPAVVAHLCNLAPGYDVVVARSGRGYEPLHAVYGRACLPRIEAMLGLGRLKVEELFADVRVREVSEEELRTLDPELRCFVNVNTPEELEAVRRLVAAEGVGESCAS